MINQEKVKDMTKMAVFENHGGEKELATSAYRRKDFVALQLMKTFVIGTISYVLIMVLVFLGAPDLIDYLNTTEGIYQLITTVFVGYLVFLGAFMVFTFFWARKRHKRSLENTKEYCQDLNRVARSYQNGTEEETVPVEEQA